MTVITVNNMCYTEQKSFFGFTSVQDFGVSLFGLKTPIVNFGIGLVYSLSAFIAGWVYNEPSAIYTLWVLMLADWITGIIKSCKNKTFTSSRLFRMPLYFLATTFVISISWNIANNHILFTLVPSFILGGFYSVYLVSLIENLGELNLLPKRMVNALKNRFGFKSFLDKVDKENPQ